MDRPLAGFVIAALVVLMLGPIVIARLARLKGQQINPDAPGSHRTKQGTPTMGGLLILAGIVAGSMAAGWVRALPLLFITLSYGAIGFLDDWLAMRRGKNLGLKARHKSALQVLAALAWMLLVSRPALGSRFLWPLSPAPWPPVSLSTAAFVALGVFYIVALSNAVNLTDGVDGLASSTACVCSLVAGIACLSTGAVVLATLAFSLAGACVGFLWFNSHPAQVFMGDTGSLPIGALLAAIGLSGGIPTRLLLASAVFIAEAASVVIQVAYFKRTKKRIFRMSPLHHHFELAGWKEPQLVARFVVVGMLAGAAALIGARHP